MGPTGHRPATCPWPLTTGDFGRDNWLPISLDWAGESAGALSDNLTHHELSLTDAANTIKSGKISSQDYATKLCEQARRHADLNCFIHFDSGRLLSDARKADEMMAAGKKLGPLHGVPVAIKDCIDVAGLPTTGGTPSLRDNVVQRSSTIAQKLFDAGALLMGKTNLHELAFGITSSNEWSGAVGNPHNPSYSAGGSSSGSAAVVAAHIAPAALGTDTAGSVRIPAAHCGVFGFRPSHGRYDTKGVMPLFPTRDTPGTFARSIDDLLLLDSVLTDGWALPGTGRQGGRLGIPGDYFLNDLEDVVSVAVEEAFKKLESSGFVLVDAPPPDFAGIVSETGGPIRAWELPRSIAKYLEACGNGVCFEDVLSGIAGDYVRTEFSEALKDTESPGLAQAYRNVMTEILPRHRQSYREYLSQYDLDAIVFPTVPLAPTRLGDNVSTQLNGKPVSIWRTMRNALPASFFGAPGITIPYATTPDGMPLGLEFDGAPGADRQLLALAAAWARALS